MDWGLLALALLSAWAWGVAAVLMVMLGVPPAPPRRLSTLRLAVALAWPLLPLVLGTAWLMLRAKAADYDLPP